MSAFGATRNDRRPSLRMPPVHRGSTATMRLSDQLYELLRLVLGPEDGDPRNASPHHRHLVAAMQPRTHLAILEDLVRQLSLVLDRPKAVFEEEIRNSS